MFEFEDMGILEPTQRKNLSLLELSVLQAWAYLFVYLHNEQTFDAIKSFRAALSSKFPY